MKILHTSDWHLGQNFHDYDRTFEHQTFLQWLSAQILDLHIDVVLVSGDIYDTSSPSIASQKMLAQWIATTKAMCKGVQIILTGGNHDSGPRLESPGALAQAFDCHIIGNLPRHMVDGKIAIDWDRTIIPLRDVDGAIRAYCAAVPFVRTEEYSLYRSMAQDLYGDQSYQSCLKALYADLEANLTAKVNPDHKKIVMGHLHLSRGEISEGSERKLIIGGEEAVDDSLFGPFWDYVALGHLHKAQALGRPQVRYSGSPLPLSFAELNYKHQVVVLDIDSMDCQIVPVPRTVELLCIPKAHAPKAEVLDLLKNYVNPQVESPSQCWPYLCVQVALEKADADLIREIHEALVGKSLRLCRIDVRSSNHSPMQDDLWIEASAGLEQLSPQRVFDDLCLRKFKDQASPELSQAFAQLLEKVQNQAGEEA